MMHIRAFLKACLPDDSIIELPKGVRWQFWDQTWESAQCIVIVTTKGYDTLSRQSIKRSLFVRLFLGDGPGESQDEVLDDFWTVLWTGEPLPREVAKLSSIHIDNHGGLRHNIGLELVPKADYSIYHISFSSRVFLGLEGASVACGSRSEG